MKIAVDNKIEIDEIIRCQNTITDQKTSISNLIINLYRKHFHKIC